MGRGLEEDAEEDRDDGDDDDRRRNAQPNAQRPPTLRSSGWHALFYRLRIKDITILKEFRSPGPTGSEDD